MDVCIRVEAYMIAAPEQVTGLGIYCRYLREVLTNGNGRSSDTNAHNNAVKGLLRSAGSLFLKNAVDRISIHTFLAR
jgi:hypothetical protein